MVVKAVYELKADGKSGIRETMLPFDAQRMKIVSKSVCIFSVDPPKP